MFRYFYTPLISNYKFEITTLSQIALYDNLINFNLIIQYKWFIILDYPKSASGSLE